MAVLTGPVADAHHAVVTVDGVTIDRTALRGRMVLDAELAAAQDAALRTASTAGLLTPEAFAELSSAIARSTEDPLRSAIDGLVRDQLIRVAAQAEGLASSVELDLELARAVTASLGTYVRVVTIAQPYADPPTSSGDWPRPAPASATAATIDTARAAAAERVRAAFESGTPTTDIVDGLAAVGWRVTGSDRWIPITGAVAGLPDAFVAAMRSAEANQSVGTYDDPWTGTTAVGRRLGDQIDGTTAAGTIDRSAIDAGVLRDWADAQAAERALRTAFAQRWATQPGHKTRVIELVVGLADLDGTPRRYRSFAHLVIHQLQAPMRMSGESDAALADRLFDELTSLRPDDRARRFNELMAAADRTPSDDPLSRSGELGFFTADQLLPELAEVAFAPEAVTGSVLRPVMTVVGPELFMVRGTFEGVLDERTDAALIEARWATDLLALARRISPTGSAPRASGSLWRADDEVVAEPTIEAAYLTTPLGARSDPIVLDGQIVVVVPIERSTGSFDRAMIDRLLVRGVDAWLSGRSAAATIVRDREPLPGIVVESIAPSAGPSDGASSPIGPGQSGREAPPATARPFPLATPPLIP